jgi:endonuclease/exonuclease/phosphatase family metal-dependent hydrolase
MLAINNNTLLMGDFNLDWREKDLASYSFKNYFDDLEAVTGNLNLTKLVNFPTLSKVVNNVLRASVIDHIYVAYVANFTSILSLSLLSP